MWKFNHASNRDVSSTSIIKKLLNDNNVVTVTFYGLMLIFIVSALTGN